MFSSTIFSEFEVSWRYILVAPVIPLFLFWNISKCNLKLTSKRKWGFMGFDDKCVVFHTSTFTPCSFCPFKMSVKELPVFHEYSPRPSSALRQIQKTWFLFFRYRSYFDGIVLYVLLLFYIGCLPLKTSELSSHFHFFGNLVSRKPGKDWNFDFVNSFLRVTRCLKSLFVKQAMCSFSQTNGLKQRLTIILLKNDRFPVRFFII